MDNVLITARVIPECARVLIKHSSIGQRSLLLLRVVESKMFDE